MVLHTRIGNLRRHAHDRELRVRNLLAHNPEGGKDAIASFAVKVGAISAVKKDPFASDG